MDCLTCEELHDRAYVVQINSKLTNHFSSHPCVDCGETEIEVLVFSDKTLVWNLIADQTPWPKVNSAIHSVEVVCANCLQRRTAEKIGPWGIPIKRWKS